MNSPAIVLRNTFIHVDLQEESQKARYSRSCTIPASFFLSEEAKNFEKPLSTVSAAFDSLSVSTRDSTASVDLSLSEFDSDDTLSSSDVSDGSYIVSPSGRCNRLNKYVKEEEEKTTIMIRNIPQGMTQNELLEQIELAIPGVNFLYLPQSRKRQGNVGYAFVNFTTPDKAEECLSKFQSTKLTGHKSSKTLDVGFATLQGFKQNVRFYRRSKVCKSKNRPYMKF